MEQPNWERAALEKSQYELKKVQQRTIAIIIFAVVYQCSFVLVAFSRGLYYGGRENDAYLLIAIGYLLAIGQTVLIRGILGQRLFSIFWLVLALIPLVAFHVFYFAAGA